MYWKYFLWVPRAVSHKRDSSKSLPSADNFPLIVTDPPYFDNIGYADLADFYYVWHRQNLQAVFPDLFNLMLVPKSEELVASTYRFGGRQGEGRGVFSKWFAGCISTYAQSRSSRLPDDNLLRV